MGTVDSASLHCLESALRPKTILRSNLIDSSYQTSHSRNQLKAKQEEDNGDNPTHDFKLPLQNYCQHNAGTISNWAVQSGCDGGQNPLHLWPAWSQHHWGDGMIFVSISINQFDKH